MVLICTAQPVQGFLADDYAKSLAGILEDPPVNQPSQSISSGMLLRRLEVEHA